jgi:hypothetical protein
MTRNDAVLEAVQRVNETGSTFVVLRRGYAYKAQIVDFPISRGWKIAEQIGPGNVQNFRRDDVA